VSLAAPVRLDERVRAVGSAPGRVNLIGEHTDYSGGFVLPFAIDARTAVSVTVRADDQLNLHSLQAPDSPATLSLQHLRPGTPLGWGAYVAGVIWVLRNDGVAVPGLDVVVDGGVPIGAGLASSAALTCATALAVVQACDVHVPPAALAVVAQRAENDYVGVPCGVMDQTAAMTARADHALFLDVQSMAVEHIPLRPADHDLELLVIDTGARHQLAEGAYAERRRSVEAATELLDVDSLRALSVDDLSKARQRLSDEMLLRRVRHVVTENQRVIDTVALLRDDRITDIGPLLTASHASLRDDFMVSSPELDTVVEACTRAGALGARLTGGGFGGSVIALAPMSAREALVNAVGDAARLAGYPTPTVLPVAPSSGASSVRRPSS
jgi:galactokinase